MKFSGLHLSKNYIPSPKTFTDLSNITFNYLCENPPNSLCHFWNHKSFFTTELVNINLAQTLHTFEKISHQKGKFQTFDCSRKILPNLYFDRLLKVYKSLAEKYKGVISHDPKDWCWKTDLSFQKWWIWWNLTWALASLQNLHFYLLLLCKVFNVWPKKVHSDARRVMQNLKKNWLVVWKMTWGIWQIFTRALESLKIGILMGSFNPK